MRERDQVQRRKTPDPSSRLKLMQREINSKKNGTCCSATNAIAVYEA